MPPVAVHVGHLEGYAEHRIGREAQEVDDRRGETGEQAVGLE
ncbi:MAG TPA: hypothetical protein VFE21_03240 [Rubrobacteraceae bacterium]|nr:hypothetical protein [Rubrobacteraceae bacterium]